MEQKIEELVSRLTLEEKAGMIHGCGLFATKGVERLGIPPLTMSDGPMGVRHDFENAAWRVIGNTDDYVTYLPSNSAIASTWNRDVARSCGQVLGEEARGRGKDVILAPGINIKRSPLCGRNFEYMSEDPYLTGELAVPMIQGIQEQDTAACVKHFALNNQETERLWVEVEVDDAALHEIYLPAFEKAVKEGGSWSLMGAYNLWHGEHCCESRELLNRLLREEWKYDGMVVSDWGAVHNTEKAAESGLDIEMSVTDNFDEYCLAEPLIRAVKEGRVPEEWIDRKVRNILRLLLRIGKMDPENRKPGAYNTPKHRQTVLDAARESVILLKNEDQLLPLDRKKVKKLLVVGDNANRIHSCGGGSAEIKALYEVTPFLGIKKLLGGNVQVDYVQGYFPDDCEELPAEINWQADSLKPSDAAAQSESEYAAGTAQGSGRTEDGEGHEAKEAEVSSKGPELLRLKSLKSRQEELRRQAVGKAAQYDTVIFVGGQNHHQDTEGGDRENMTLPYAQDELIRELTGVNPNTIVVLFSGSPVEMPWADRAKALVWQYYSGMEGGTALAEVLFGDVNPSGRLAESFPIHCGDCPAHSIGEFPGGKTVRYTEGLFVGYRHYHTRHVPVLFPFGFGLSYTDFSICGLCVENGETRQQGAEGSFEPFRLSVKVTNTGDRAGMETVQLYVEKADGEADRPSRELKAFEKVELQPGESRTVEFTLGREAFCRYDADSQAFVTVPGVYRIGAGRNVEEICAETEVTV